MGSSLTPTKEFSIPKTLINLYSVLILDAKEMYNNYCTITKSEIRLLSKIHVAITDDCKPLDLL